MTNALLVDINALLVDIGLSRGTIHHIALIAEQI